MRIPSSTIVMGLITCVPFALAIRQGTPNRHADDDDEVDAEMVMAREAQMRADLEAEKARRAEAKIAELHQLYGTLPGTPGTLFSGIQLEAAEVTPAQERHVGAFGGATIELLTDDTGLYQIHVTPRPELCTDLDVKLEETWGPGNEIGDGRVWLDPATAHRAHFEHVPGKPSDPPSNECSLSFDRYEAPPGWIDRQDGSVVPVWAIGQPAEKLTDALTRPPGDAKHPTISWTGRGVGVGNDRTHLTAEVQHGKITGIVALGDATPATLHEVRHRIAELYGEPKNSDDDQVARWAGKLPIVLEQTDHGFTLSIGSAVKPAK